ncbi:MAG: diaminopimelate decarboxylase [Bacteroidetes bacterium]|nr:MAG: diaminopimelate decarboxylase [Bacteroidota bacterium]
MFSNQTVEKFSSLRTPFYYYDTPVLRHTLDALKKAASKHDFHVHYAMKANTNDVLLDIIRSNGLGADCVSGNEVKRALECGFAAHDVVFAGVGKSDEEIMYALQHDILCFNCESLQEMEVIDGLAKSMNKKTRIAIRINPNVNANTHHLWELETVVAALKQLTSLELIGLHFHIGSQITDLSAFKSLCLRVNEIQEWFVSRKIALTHINVGGGLGVDYHQPDTHTIPDFESYFNIFAQFLERRRGQQVHFELGRAVIAQCGSLISRVLYVKKGIRTDFTILDAGMTELIRPALYQSYHKIENISPRIPKDAPMQRYDVVGPICESSDCFGKAVDLPETRRGDLVAIRTAGAYGEVMMSQYNLRDRAGVHYSDTL